MAFVLYLEYRTTPDFYTKIFGEKNLVLYPDLYGSIVTYLICHVLTEYDTSDLRINDYVDRLWYKPTISIFF